MSLEYRPGFTLLYALTEPEQAFSISTVRYIGKTDRHPDYRFKKHIESALYFKNWDYHALRWIRKLLREGRQPVMHLLASVPSEYGSAAEVRLIQSFRAAGARLTNSTIGGEGCLGLKHSEEAKRKNSERQRGRKGSEKQRQAASEFNKKRWTPEARKRHSELMKRVPFTDERRQKISAALMGSKVSEETKTKLRQYNLGKTHSLETRKKIRESLRRPDVRARLIEGGKRGAEARWRPSCAQ